MKRIHINRITILFNFIFLLVLSSYFYINMSDNQMTLKLKKEKIVINNNVVPITHYSNIEIEIVKLPKVQQSSHNELKIKNKKLLLPIKYKKQSLPNDFKAIRDSQLLNNKKNSVVELIPIKYENKSFQIENKSSQIQMKPIKYIKETVKTEQKFNVKKIINIGAKALENTKNFQLEFLWPFNTLDHDKIYKILNQCLQSQTVLMDSNEMIFGLNGKIDRETLNNEFSKIIRVPTYVHSSIEKNNIKNIQNKFLQNSSGKHLRLYRKNIDAYIIGFYLNLAKNNQIRIKNIKKIKGKYSLINDELFLDNLVINSFNFKDKILLSSLGNKCSI